MECARRPRVPPKGNRTWEDGRLAAGTAEASAREVVQVFPEKPVLCAVGASEAAGLVTNDAGERVFDA